MMETRRNDEKTAKIIEVCWSILHYHDDHDNHDDHDDHDNNNNKNKNKNNKNNDGNPTTRRK
jgi:hypothetical protein